VQWSISAYTNIARLIKISREAEKGEEEKVKEVKSMQSGRAK
jgi:hypothetical protein